MHFGFHVTKNNKLFCHVTGPSKPSHYINYVHINVLELKATFLAVQAFLKHQPKSIGKTQPRQHNGNCLYQQPRRYSFTQSHVIDTRTVVLVPSTEHFDHCRTPSGCPQCSSRQMSREHLSTRANICPLQPQILQPFLKDREIDLFATRLTIQLKRYVSWRPDPHAVATDAFSIDWIRFQFEWIRVPTIQPHPKSINESDKQQREPSTSSPSVANSTLVAITTTTQLTVNQPVLLSVSPPLLEDLSNPRAIHPMHQTL